MEPFVSYPDQGRIPLGPPRNLNGTCRSGYGLSLQRLTGQTSCAYCGLSLVDTYAHWLLLSVDHVVPRAEALRLGIDLSLSEDTINLVLCCAGCNGFGNRYRTTESPQSPWTLDAFLALRDRVFAERSKLVEGRRGRERVLFAARSWE